MDEGGAQTSAGDGFEALERALGGKRVGGLEALSPEQAGHLAEAINAARREQNRALSEAAESALGFLPGFVRGAVKRIVFG